MRPLAHLIVVATLARADCIAVHSDRITAGDIAAAVPQFEKIDSRTTVAFTPLPGARRLLSGGELRAAVQRYGVVLNAGEIVPGVCVERFVSPIAKEELQKALLAAIGIDDARFELLDFSNQAVPEGRFEFRLSGLSRPPAIAPESSVIWRGRFVYDGERSLAVWARVRITVDRPVFVASEEIAARTVIRAEQLRATVVRQSFPRGPAIDSVGEIAGKIARRRIAAGETVAPGLLDEAKEVLKGNQVHVRVVDGQASLSFDAVAETSGKTGETVLVHNPTSGRNFHAVVQAKGQVLVRSGESE